MDMDILSKRTIELTSLAMNGLAEKHKAITSNIANANTPGYTKTDVEFESQLQKILESEKAHQKEDGETNTADYSAFKPKIIISGDSSLEGNINNVNIEMEMAALAKNGMKYNALAALQAKAFKGMSDVIMGGGR